MIDLSENFNDTKYEVVCSENKDDQMENMILEDIEDY
jgi:hypothetical protein